MQEKNPSLSVIIPAYNIVSVIDKCLQSIINQSFDNFEVVIVNDCSTDDTQQVLAEWAIKDNRLKIINLKKNSGVSAARNTGLQNAKGQFITFVDADDYVEPNYFQKALGNETDFDIIVLGFKQGFDESFISFTPNNTLAEKLDEVRDTYLALENKIELFLGPWNKFFRREIIEKHKIIFPKFSLGEDQCFVFEYLNKIKTMKTVDFPGYVYIRDNNKPSLSRGARRSFKELDEFLNLKFRLENNFRKKIKLEPYSLEQYSKKNLSFYVTRAWSLYSGKYPVKVNDRIKALKRMRKEPWSIHFRKTYFGKKYSVLKIIWFGFPAALADLTLIKIFRNK